MGVAEALEVPRALIVCLGVIEEVRVGAEERVGDRDHIELIDGRAAGATKAFTTLRNHSKRVGMRGLVESGAGTKFHGRGDSKACEGARRACAKQKGESAPKARKPTPNRSCSVIGGAQGRESVVFLSDQSP